MRKTSNLPSGGVSYGCNNYLKGENKLKLYRDASARVSDVRQC